MSHNIIFLNCMLLVLFCSTLQCQASLNNLQPTFQNALSDRRRRLDACSLTKGATVNTINADCSMSDHITIAAGEQLTVRGGESITHPILDRNGAAAPRVQPLVHQR